MKLAELVTRRRKERGLSMRDVAKTGNVSPNAMHKIEHGLTVDPQLSTLLGLAKALKLQPKIIFEAARESYEGAPDDRAEDGRGAPDLEAG